MNRRKQGLNLWILLVLAWALLRALVVNDVFSKYGVNGAVYLWIDLISSIPYALTSARALFAYLDRDRKQFFLQALMASTCFYIPDIYIIFSARQVPDQTYIGLGVWIAIMSVLAILKFIKDKAH